MRLFRLARRLRPQGCQGTTKLRTLHPSHYGLQQRACYSPAGSTGAILGAEIDDSNLPLSQPNRTKQARIQTIERQNRVRLREVKEGLRAEAHYEGMEIIFLGTGGNRPTPTRNATCIALRVRGSTLLFDCAEGSQQQVLLTPRVHPGTITRIFISHMHSDHVFGLPAVLLQIFESQTSTRTNRKALPRKRTDIENVTEVYGPVGIAEFLYTTLHLTATLQKVPRLKVFELDDYDGPDASGNKWQKQAKERRGNFQLQRLSPDKDGVWTIGDMENDGYTVQATLMPHKPRMSTFAFVVTENDEVGNIDVERLVKMGVPPGPVYGLLKEGETVRLPNGKKINGKDFTGPPRKGRKVSIIMDTYDSTNAIEISKGSDLMVHEASFDSSYAEEAKAKGHSTGFQAGQMARQAGVDSLVLTHISARYPLLKTRFGSNMLGVDIIVDDAIKSFGSERVIAASDFIAVPIYRCAPGEVNEYKAASDIERKKRRNERRSNRAISDES